MIGWVILILILLAVLYYWVYIRVGTLALKKGQYLTLPGTLNTYVFGENAPYTVKVMFTLGSDFDKQVILVSKYNTGVSGNWFVGVSPTVVTFVREGLGAVHFPQVMKPNIRYTLVIYYDGAKANFTVSSDLGVVTGVIPFPNPSQPSPAGNIMVGTTLENNVANGTTCELDLHYLQIVDNANKTSLTWKFPELKAAETTNTFVLGTK
jgi:hypothetical protein